jgi:hypothetical protein
MYSIQILNQLADFYKTVYELYAIGSLPKDMLFKLRISSNNIREERNFQIGATTMLLNLQS